MLKIEKIYGNWCYLDGNGAWTNNVPQGNISKSNAEALVRNYLINNGQDVPNYIQAIDNGNSYAVRCYDDMGTHTATSGWYYVDKNTGIITSIMF